MNLYHYIGELLYSHDCVVVPGLGGFVTSYVPAKIHPILHTFSPPSKAVLFNVRLQSNDGVLANYISKKENISYTEAMMRINESVVELDTALEKSRTVEILKVGIIYRDAESNLQFEPTTEANYLLSSFGLTEFISPAVQRDVFRLRQEKRLYERPVPRRDRRVPVALKRAVWIGLPLAAIIVAGFLSINPLKELYTQYSGVFPETATSKETVSVTEPSGKSPALIINDLCDIRLPSGFSVTNDKTLPYPVTGTYSSSADTTGCIAANAASTERNKYFVIGGCFQIKENAERFLVDLKKKGFANAGLMLPGNKKLFHVYYSGFDDKKSAVQALKRIQEEGTPEAWLFEL
jgi:hypothetical protein